MKTLNELAINNALEQIQKHVDPKAHIGKTDGLPEVRYAVEGTRIITVRGKLGLRDIRATERKVFSYQQILDLYNEQVG